jgi:hypothetical protein
MLGRPAHPRVTHVAGGHERQTWYEHHPVSGYFSTSQADTLKGSYYANPLIDHPSVHPSLQEAYPEYYGANICQYHTPRPWMVSKIECCRAPEREGHRGLRIRVQGTWIVRSGSFNSISWPSPTFIHSFVFDVGLKLAAACQPFASPHLTDSSISLSELIRPSQTTKARLLHYFPPTPGNRLPTEDEPIDSWCGFHVDHSLLTGLCSVCHSHSEARRDLEVEDLPDSDMTGAIHPARPGRPSKGGPLTFSLLRTLYPDSWW